MHSTGSDLLENAGLMHTNLSQSPQVHCNIGKNCKHPAQSINKHHTGSGFYKDHISRSMAADLKGLIGKHKAN